ncbi:MAG: Flp pilus assembly protein CpaB [Planctomycetota bacterium]
MTNKLAVLLAVILGVVAALAMQASIREQKDEEIKRYPLMKILVASRTIRENEPLKLAGGEMLRLDSYPQRHVKTGMITSDQAYLYGGFIAKRRIEPGEPIFQDDLEPPYERAVTEASVVDDGRRAVTLAVDMVAGVAGLIRPGDRVDVVATFDMGRGAAGAVQQGVVTLYLLQNVRVIALDSRMEKVRVTEDRPAARTAYRTATLELDPADALRVINAQEQGRIRLLLRNRLDTAAQPAERGGKPIGVNVVANELKEIAPHAP